MTGGPTTVDNIQLRCGAHNQYEADLFYGPIRDAMFRNMETDQGPMASSLRTL